MNHVLENHLPDFFSFDTLYQNPTLLDVFDHHEWAIHYSASPQKDAELTILRDNLPVVYILQGEAIVVDTPEVPFTLLPSEVVQEAIDTYNVLHAALDSPIPLTQETEALLNRRTADTTFKEDYFAP